MIAYYPIGLGKTGFIRGTRGGEMTVSLTYIMANILWERFREARKINTGINDCYPAEPREILFINGKIRKTIALNGDD